VTLRAPQLRGEGLALDGGENICRDAGDSRYPLACGRPAATTIVSAGVSDFSPKVYPSPWRVSQHPTEPIHFDGVRPGATIKIFTLSSRWVKTISATSTHETWNLTNDAGEAVASGYYLYLVTTPTGERARGKLAIIR
jgi:hypothetical protein